MASTPIQIVDEHNRPVRAGTQQEAWQKGLHHQIVRMMIEDGTGNILLQKRALGKKLYPGRWDSSAAGHVDAGETYEQAASRELGEELGLTNQLLQKKADFYIDTAWEQYRLRVFVRLYSITLPQLPPLDLATEEVTEVRWMSVPDIKTLIANQPDALSGGLIEVIERYY